MSEKSDGLAEELEKLFPVGRIDRRAMADIERLAAAAEGAGVESISEFMERIKPKPAGPLTKKMFDDFIRDSGLRKAEDEDV